MASSRSAWTCARPASSEHVRLATAVNTSSTALGPFFEEQLSGLVITADGRTNSFGDPTAVVSVASVTKPLFAYAVLIAIEEGSIDLDEPVGPFGSTVRHLLAHAGGVGFTETDPVSAPETRRIYSNYGFDLLGRHLEQATGFSSAEYLAEAVFQPLGMASSNLNGSPAKDALSTADDLARFVEELLHPTLISRETQRQMTTVQFPGLAGIVPGIGPFRPNPWGLGVEIRGAKNPHWTGRNNSVDTYGHFGANGSFIWIDPVHEVATIVTNDRAFGPWALTSWPALSDAVLDQFG